jgi:hypothetical protein
MYASGITNNERLTGLAFFSTRSAMSDTVSPSGYFCSSILTAWWLLLCIFT